MAAQRFENRVALVTGGSSGIGEAVARLIAEEGGQVAVVASSRVEKAQEAIATFPEEARARAKAYTADVSQVDAVNGLVDSVTADFGRIDILVNCAGLFYPTPIDDASEDAYDRMMTVNLKGTWFAIAAVVPQMKERGSGKIVNLSSVAGVTGVPQHALYCASKAAVMMMTRALAIDLAPHGININAVAPGNTETPMNEAVRTDPAFAEMLAGMTAATPSPRTFTPPGEIAGCVAFLASDAASAMYGATMLVDEGIAAGL